MLAAWEADEKELYESTAADHVQPVQIQQVHPQEALFTTSLIQQAVSSTKSSKVADEHGLIIEFLKMVNITSMMATLAGIFNGLLAEGWFPTTWAEPIVVPLFKAGR